MFELTKMEVIGVIVMGLPDYHLLDGIEVKMKDYL